LQRTVFEYHTTMKLRFLLMLGVALFTTSGFGAEKKSVVMIAGTPSHGPGDHEYNAGVLLLKKCLDKSAPQVAVKAHLSGGWPSVEELAQADTILLYTDGGGANPLLQGGRLQQLAAQIKRGCGLIAVHYSLEAPKDNGGPQLREGLGAYFEPFWSVNPFWTPDFKPLPKHPITNGVRPFSTTDEWYFHMRFRDGMQGITPILTAIAPPETINREDSSHGGNPAVRAEVAAKVPQHVAWATERADGGRGFGFTGGHVHKGWGNDDQRKLVLNAILWTAKVAVPANGVESKITPEELAMNLDAKGQ
jgi:type 1 glutamine amidotransferase